MAEREVGWYEVKGLAGMQVLFWDGQCWRAPWGEGLTAPLDSRTTARDPDAIFPIYEAEP